MVMPACEAALEQEQARAQQPRLGVEPPAQKLVGRVDVQPPVHRQEDRGDDDQRQRRPK